MQVNTEEETAMEYAIYATGGFALWIMFLLSGEIPDTSKKYI